MVSFLLDSVETGQPPTFVEGAWVGHGAVFLGRRWGLATTLFLTPVLKREQTRWS